MKPVLLFLMLAVASACSSDEARVSVQYVPRADLAALTPSVVVAAPGLRRTLSSGEVGATGAREPLTFATPTAGRLDLEFALVDGGTIAATGVLNVDLRGDWTWGFRISIDSVNPARFCFGCTGSMSFPLAAAYRRSQ